ncbi:MAG TPA: HEPN domain-containing protein [Blastocatellia bacterium]|nr:HEPN domain-containing protein [Blastocatellia bacterium]
MQNREIARQLNRLYALIKKSEEACAGNLELQAEWAKYLCILSAGLIENALKEIYIEFAQKKTSRPIANFLSSIISPIRNPKTQRFLDIAAAFNPTWKDELENHVNINGRLEAIDSIMNQRHLIAHGQNQNSNITLAKLKDYLAKSVEVLEFIEQQCNR